MLRRREYRTYGDYEVIGLDTRTCIRNTTVAPFRYICSIDLNGPCCSGTLIGPRTVLTAGHCITPPSCSVVPGVTRVIPGRNGRLVLLLVKRGRLGHSSRQASCLAQRQTMAWSFCVIPSARGRVGGRLTRFVGQETR